MGLTTLIPAGWPSEWWDAEVASDEAERAREILAVVLHAPTG